LQRIEFFTGDAGVEGVLLGRGLHGNQYQQHCGKQAQGRKADGGEEVEWHYTRSRVGDRYVNGWAENKKPRRGGALSFRSI
jgi:hypothetical protein